MRVEPDKQANALANALARAQYEERKSRIGALEAQKAQLKEELDAQNVILCDAKAQARNLQRQIDEIDDSIRALRTPGQAIAG